MAAEAFPQLKQDAQALQDLVFPQLKRNCQAFRETVLLASLENILALNNALSIKD
jgi:hypothetical protein